VEPLVLIVELVVLQVRPGKSELTRDRLQPAGRRIQDTVARIARPADAPDETGRQRAEGVDVVEVADRRDRRERDLRALGGEPEVDAVGLGQWNAEADARAIRLRL